MYFQDVMDPTRFVKIVKTNGSSNHCRVYFKDSGRLEFAGVTDLPSTLFGTAPVNRYIGFVPANP